MQAFADRFVRPMVADDIKRLLELRIRRISAYDIERNRGELEEIERSLLTVAAQLAELTETTIAYLEGLIAKFGSSHPRRTRAESFETIEKKSVARPSIKLGYDRTTGFFGSAVKAGSRELLASEFDLILGIADDGSYRVMTPPEKVLFDRKLIHLELFDPDAGASFTVVYRDRGKNVFGKRVRIEKFIRNREYQLIKDKAGTIDLLLPGDAEGVLSMEFLPAPRQRTRTAKFDLSKLDLMGVAARGSRLARKPVGRVKLMAAKPLRSGRKPTVGVRKGQASLF
jgi:topoisomerase-4 subunit A